MKECKNVAGNIKIGVLALQGAFREHRHMLTACGVTAIEVRTPDALTDVAGLVIPGGESTTIGKLMQEWGLLDAIIKRGQAGMPIYGTCAGMILLCQDIQDSDQPRLGLMDACVRRNAFGRQRESFETELEVKGWAQPLHAVFIRAPYLERVGPAVNVLAQVNEKIVIAQQENILVSAFHSELTEDTRLHKHFIHMVEQTKK
jgi:5'-phosphate synthase pdxT subunit